MKKMLTLVFAVLFVLSLASCVTNADSNNENALTYDGLSVYGLSGMDANQLVTPWSISVRMYRNDGLPEGGFITVRPQQHESPVTVQAHIDWRLGQVDLENCIVRPNGEDDPSPSFQGSSSTAVSAGENITINAPSGPIYTISIDDTNRYRLNDLSDVLPKDATLSLPGEIFPTVSAYSITDTTTPDDLSPSFEQTVDINTRFTWEAGTNTSSYMEILFYEYGPDGGLLDAPMRCDVLDDGEFELTSEALDYIASSENEIKVGYFRVERRIDFNDGILFFQTGYAVGGNLSNSL